jgi:hypothetical protein
VHVRLVLRVEEMVDHNTNSSDARSAEEF